MVQPQLVYWKHLGLRPFDEVWQMQEAMLAGAVAVKKEENNTDAALRTTVHKLLLVEHPPVYTLGKSGSMSNLLISEQNMKERGISFFKINRGGDITHHGPGQLVAYPILDLEKFYTDIGRYLRSLEEVVMRTLSYYGIESGRSAGETGVWIDADKPGRERKICAMGVRCSRWITMHGLALNVNNDLDYFNHIVPCGISDKQVTSIAQELGIQVDMAELILIFLKEFEAVFQSRCVAME